jgi:hypothetical protein
MEATRIGSGQPPVNGAAMKIEALYQEDDSDSDPDSDSEDLDLDALVAQPRAQMPSGINEIEIHTSEGEEDDWEVDSLFEDAIEELGDEHLFNGGGEYRRVTIWPQTR